MVDRYLSTKFGVNLLDSFQEYAFCTVIRHHSTKFGINPVEGFWGNRIYGLTLKGAWVSKKQNVTKYVEVL